MKARFLSLVVLAVAVTTNVLAAPSQPTVDEARKFVAHAEQKLLDLWIQQQRAAWVKSNFITDDTEAMEAQANQELISTTVSLALEAKRFEKLSLPYDLQRKLYILRSSPPLVAPTNTAKQKELAEIASWMEGVYGKGQYCPAGKSGSSCLDIGQITRILAESRDPKELLDVWLGWHKISEPIRPKFKRFVQLANEGARELGFSDLGALWRSNYDMPPNAFASELDRLWEQVKPLYVPLHCYVRSKLAEKYGKSLVPDGKPIPAQLLGNLWAQDWTNIYDLVKPKHGDPGYDLTKILKNRKTEPLQMVHYGEAFFTSLGFDPLPKTFWERSLFAKPRDRDVVCHASAWDIDFKDDLRIKMCIDITGDEFRTIHHELGHNFYQRAYDKLSPLYEDSANDGFHEGIGDTIALSVTPEYLKKIGLLTKVPPPEADIGILLNKALEKVAFLPFGLLIDKWRWEVFSGKVSPAHYNQAWWDLKLKYQGVAPPVSRNETDFDPGAKYHIAANVPYMRYFLADILQFQFHRALCKEAGWTGPLNRCSIYGNKKAGAKLNHMLQMGRSRPWPEALKAMTGEKRMDATAIRDYFEPLRVWLEEQNRGQTCGW